MRKDTVMERASTRERFTTTSALPPLGRFYDVGGQRLLLHRSGTGSPAVILLPGAGAVGLDYLNIQQRAAEFTTSVLYDRAGTGWSDRIDVRRSSSEVTDELRALLNTAGIAAPYLLVGHSLGGLYARHYTLRFPEEVAGLVLLDPAHEEYMAYMPQEVVEQRKAWDPDRAVPDVLPDEVVQLYRDLFTQEMRDWPERVREPLIDGHVSSEWLRVSVQEAKNVEQQYDEVRNAGALPDVPLIVLSSMSVDAFKQRASAGSSESLLREEIEGKWRLYTKLADSVPRGEIRPVDAGHATIHYRCLDAVVQAIQDVLAEARA
jgi:pimeloyl-ACP methyl ester carboxylesterase